MGAECKKQSEENKKKAEDKLVFDPRLIFFDDDGNLRYDEGGTVVKLKEEIKEIMSSDDIIEEPNKLWYVMDTAWLAAWLAYTQTSKGVSPRPGPCRNNRLIIWDEEVQSFVARSDLNMASKTWKGDYRRVSEATWNAFLKYYPGSGPAITLEYSPATDKVPQIIQNWKVIDSIEAPDDTKRKKMKMRLWRSKNELEKNSLATDEGVDTIIAPVRAEGTVDTGIGSNIDLDRNECLASKSGVSDGILSSEDINVTIDPSDDSDSLDTKVTAAKPLLSNQKSISLQSPTAKEETSTSRLSSTSSMSGGSSFLSGLRPSLSDHKPKPLVLGSPAAYKDDSKPLVPVVAAKSP